jgi:hypothetical protein
MAAMLRLLLLAALATAPLQPPAAAPTKDPARGEVVERIVAVVRNPASGTPRPLTLTKLVEEARVALVGQGAIEAASAPLDDAALRAALRWLVDQWLVSDEAARLQVGEATHQETLAAVDRFRERFPGAEAYRRFLAALDLTEEDLGTTLARGLRVQRYLEGRVSRAGRIGDEELTRALAASGLRAEAPGVREAVRSRLVEERLQADLRQVLVDLRARAEVRVLVPALREDAAR